MADRMGEIARHLRDAESSLRIAVSIAGDYRGKIWHELICRAAHRRGVKALIRIGEIADKIERARAKP